MNYKKNKHAPICNIDFLASYIFLYPGSSSAEARRALYCWHNKKLDSGFKKGQTYKGYFEDAKEQSYAGTLWSSPRRSRWVIQGDGLKRVRPELFEAIREIKNCVANKKSSYFNKVDIKKEGGANAEAKATH